MIRSVLQQLTSPRDSTPVYYSEQIYYDRPWSKDQEKPKKATLWQLTATCTVTETRVQKYLWHIVPSQAVTPGPGRREGPCLGT